MSQNPEVSNQRGTARSSRFGGANGSYRIFKRGIVANEVLPAADINEGTIVGDRFEKCLWAIQMPAGVTSYDVHLLRWVSCTKENGTEIIPGFWVDEGATTFTRSAVIRQYVHGDALGLYIAAVAGVFGSGFIVLRKGITTRS